MKAESFRAFALLRQEFKGKVEAWTNAWPGLREAQQGLADAKGYAYRVETPIVYNSALDDVGPEADIGLLMVADNPGLNEQRSDRRAYLVGQSGRLAEGLFRRDLGTDFRRKVVILNKTPIHTPKTKELSGLLPAFAGLFSESQEYMADLSQRMAAALGADIWVIGYSELGKRGLFRTWAEAFRRASESSDPVSRIDPARTFVFRHFSMNQFSGDLKRRRKPGEGAMEALARIGAEYRIEKLGF